MPHSIKKTNTILYSFNKFIGNSGKENVSNLVLLFPIFYLFIIIEKIKLNVVVSYILSF